MELRSKLMETMEQRKGQAKEWGSRSPLGLLQSHWCFTFILRCTTGRNLMITLIYKRSTAILMFWQRKLWISRCSKWFRGKTTTICFSLLRTEKASLMKPGLWKQNSDGHWVVHCQNVKWLNLQQRSIKLQPGTTRWVHNSRPGSAWSHMLHE